MNVNLNLQFTPGKWDTQGGRKPVTLVENPSYPNLSISAGHIGGNAPLQEMSENILASSEDRKPTIV